MKLTWSVNPLFINHEVMKFTFMLANPLFINNEVNLECKFIIYKS